VTALEAVAVHLPPHSLPIEQVVADLGLEPKQAKLLRRFHGLDRVRYDLDGTLYDLLIGAARALEPLRGQEKRVRYVLHARSMTQVPYPLNPLDQVCRELGLEHALKFAVTHHACATGLLAVDVAGRLLEADGDPDALALIIAADKAFTRDAKLVPETRCSARPQPPLWYARAADVIVYCHMRPCCAASSTAGWPRTRTSCSVISVPIRSCWPKPFTRRSIPRRLTWNR
jgi:hypothetical protein